MSKKYSIGILVSHPIQYYVPWYRALSSDPQVDLEVFYCHRQTAQAQAQAGFGVDFNWDIPLFSGYSWKFLENKVRKPDIARFFGSDTPQITEIISERHFDAFIVQGWNLFSYWQAIGACRKTHTPVLIRGDSQLSRKPYSLKRIFRGLSHRFFVPKFDAYIATGTRSRDYFLHYGANPKDVFLAPHCVDNYFFAQAVQGLISERRALRQRWGIPQECFTFVFAGKLIPKKRPADLLRALNFAGDGCRGACALIVGDGPLRSNLQARARSMTLPVIFTGFLNQSRISEAYAVSDCLVLPSDERETWGLVVNEAFASGLPAIVSDACGCAADLVENRRTGYAYPCGDIKRLARLLQEFVLHPQGAGEMGVNARRLIEGYSAVCAADSTAQAICAIINELKYDIKR